MKLRDLIRQRSRQRKRKLQRQLKQNPENVEQPMFSAPSVQYELAERIQAINYGGIGLIHQVARQSGFIAALDQRVHVLKVHAPYHESDHVLNITYNALCEGRCLEDIELRRNDAAFLDALGATRLPDPTTAGDFCRRFQSAEQIETIQLAADDARLNVWARQPAEFFEEAVIDMDGTLVETTGQCKVGMDVAYDGTWGYHALLVSLSNTREVLRIVNRSGNRPSHEGAAPQVDQSIALCRQAGFRRIVLRGDTDFSQTEHLDRWHDGNVTFFFGYDAKPNLIELAEQLPETAWQTLVRPTTRAVKTKPRQRPANVKARVVRDREFLNLKLNGEEVAEFKYRPRACSREYRMIVIRKNISRQKGEVRLLDEIRYFFYITNDEPSTPAEVVYTCNDRCDQENLHAQLSGGCRAFTAPVDNLFSNWAYMVMTAQAWNLKAWLALWPPETGRHAAARRAEKAQLLGLEFRTFVNRLIKIPCQILRSGRRLIYRLLSWNPWQEVFFRLAWSLED